MRCSGAILITVIQFSTGTQYNRVQCLFLFSRGVNAFVKQTNVPFNVSRAAGQTETPPSTPVLRGVLISSDVFLQVDSRMKNEMTSDLPSLVSPGLFYSSLLDGR